MVLAFEMYRADSLLPLFSPCFHDRSSRSIALIWIPEVALEAI